jgi:transposase
MIDWLRRRGVAYDVSTRKANLFAEIEKLKPKDKIFKVDNMLHAHGHTALRTPPYMCGLNPIELAWANIKHYLRSDNMAGDMSLKRLEELAREGLNRVTANNWSVFCQHVVSFKNEYWVKDSVMEDTHPQDRILRTQQIQSSKAHVKKRGNKCLMYNSTVNLIFISPVMT